MSIEQKAEEIFQRLVADRTLGPFVDKTLLLPGLHHGAGEIKLIILGQDPTVKRPESRKLITKVLNSNKKGALRRYLDCLCKGLGLDFDKNIYATNYLKNFFIEPPTQFEDTSLISKFAEVWRPLLLEEIALFPDVPILSLGEPVLKLLVKENVSANMGNYWGLCSEWESGAQDPFRYLMSDKNSLVRSVFPFPHQPSIYTKQFYRSRMGQYLDFCLGIMRTPMTGESV